MLGKYADSGGKSSNQQQVCAYPTWDINPAELKAAPQLGHSYFLSSKTVSGLHLPAAAIDVLSVRTYV